MYKYSSFISPFGWGEICFRDFESIILGKLLIKPNCDHITLGQIFIKKICMYQLIGTLQI